MCSGDFAVKHMERSRFPSSRKIPIRHSPRNHTRRLNAVYVLITLLLFCMVVVFHSKLSAANASSLARLFISPITHRASDFTSPRNGTIVRKMAEGKRGMDHSRDGSRLSTLEGAEDVDMDTEVEAVAYLGTEEDLQDNGEKEEVDREDKAAKKKGDVVDGGNWDSVISKSKVHKPVKMSSWVRDNMTIEKVFPGSPEGVLQPIRKHGPVIKTLPRWDALEIVGDRSETGIIERNKSRQKSSRSPATKWDHLLGVVRQVGNLKSSSTLLQSRKATLHFKFSPLRDLHHSSLDNIPIFDSDDEPLHQYVIDNIEKISTVDDVLLFWIEKNRNVNLRSWTDKKLRTDAYKKERSSKGFLDMLNPMNNPLLQDPDTSSPNGLNGNDRAMLKALQKASAKVSTESQHGNGNTLSFQKVSQDMLATNRKNRETLEISQDELGNVAERSILELSQIDHSKAVGRRENTDSMTNKHQSPLTKLSMDKKSNSILDTRKWGLYPGLDMDLSFSDFMEQFLDDEKCSHRVFMVWTTPSWTYTVRYQRGLESVLYFHPRVCVVVFSISLELDIFTSFVEQGFRVAVVVPNLEELLAGSPADVFSSFWLPWTKTHFFHIHYSELLRLAALYKYGGIYLDTDVVLLKPLGLLHNTIGAEKTANDTRKLNGAVMAFDKNSVFLQECLIEFTETYDDQLLEFNGAALVTRVANKMANRPKKAIEGSAVDIWIEEPHVFFPLSKEDIARYFKAPDSKEEQLATYQLAEIIYNHSSMLHFWNQKTQFLVPEPSSVVETILNRHCIQCGEFL